MQTKYSPYKVANAEGFYNSQGSSSQQEYAIQQVMTKYGMSRSQAIAEIQRAEKARNNSTESSNKGAGALSFFSNALDTYNNFIQNKNAPQNQPYTSYVPTDPSKQGFKIAGMNGYVVVGGSILAIAGLIYVATKFLGKPSNA